MLGQPDAVALRRSAADASAGVRSGIVFELGYLVGRLGLKRVCVLYTGGNETFVSDHGIQFLPIDSGNGWQLHLARHLKRAVERFLVNALANLSATGQARLGDVIVVELNEETGKLAFFRDEAEESIAKAALEAAYALRNRPGNTLIAA